MNASHQALPVSDARDRWTIVVGGSAGGLDAISVLMAGLPEMNACVLAALHLAPSIDGRTFLKAIVEKTSWRCELAEDRGKPVAGHFYLAPPDHHLLMDDEEILISRGPHENRWRPAADPLFRSAAVAQRNRVIGIVLSGDLDDGSAGLNAVHRCGGACVVQDPATAAHPAMPGHAWTLVPQATPLAVEAMGGWIAELITQAPPPAPAVPRDLLLEVQFTLRQALRIEWLDDVGSGTALTCPECGGALWQMGGGVNGDHYRCHTGHAYGPDSLVAGQSDKLEQTLWASLRLMKEKKKTLESLGGKFRFESSLPERLAEIDSHIETLARLLGHGPVVHPQGD